MIAADRIAEDNDVRLAWHESDLEHSCDVVSRYGLDPNSIMAGVARFSAAAPSWAVGTGGTRFGRFPTRNATLGRSSTPEEITYLEELKITGAYI